MPRKPRKSDSATLGINPRENLLEHRNFLARSLTRNDTELAALVKLNKSLRKAKEAILQSCGEQVLLDIGVGKLKLINDELHQEQAMKKPETPSTTDNDGDGDDKLAEEEKPTVTDDEKEEKEEEKEEEKSAEPEEEETEAVHHLSPAQKDLCVDFLLRMKLRRKLCNRLARRLNRIAHTMDGQDVTPPPPPRYGDLSLNIDPEALKAKEAHWKLLKEAEERLELAKKTKPEEITSLPPPPLPPVKEEEPKKVEETPDAAAAETAGDAPKPEPDTNESSAQDKSNSESTPVKKEESNGEDPDAVPSLGSPTKKEETVPMTQSERDQEVLKTFDDAYEKVWTSHNSFKYTILDEKREPDYATIQDGGVGALNRNMTDEERSLENQRWKSAILARIPHQPTFEELGVKNKVFCLQQRLKRCREEAEDPDSPCKKPKTEGDDEDAMDVDKANGEEKGEGEPKKDEEADKATTTTSPTKEAKSPTKEVKTPEKKPSGAAEKKKESVVEEEFKPLKPMSLVAVPSFHNQDSFRLRNIQGDMIRQTIMKSAKERLTSLVHSYNDALMKSVQCYTRRTQIQQQVAVTMERGRREVAKANSDYTLKLTLSKQKWLAEKKEHDKKRLASMPSRFGQLATGTNRIQSFMRNNAANQIKLMVGSALGDVVDLTILQAEGKLTSNKKYPDYVPPPAPVVPQQFRNEQVKMKNEFDRLTTTYNQLEEQRRMKWRKYMQGRAEIEVKYGISSRRTASTYATMPCPQLNRATQQATPNLHFPVTVRANYTPTTIHRTPPSSDPKYSAAKVKQRIANDGSVAPVSEPKKTKEGLYMRPSGRTRKGMQWDAIRGLWVPEN